VSKNVTLFGKGCIVRQAIRVEILFEADTPEEIFQKEIEFISLYGRVKLDTNGILVNRTLGRWMVLWVMTAF
jgi:hypothetical protein